MVGKALRPRLGALADYSPGKGVRDLVAGLVLSILLVPQAMAYAQLAGLPPQTGLYAAIAPPVLYLFFGTSNFVSMGPVALVSLVVAEAASTAGGEPIDAAIVIAIQAGLILTLIGALGLGRLVNFISEPVLLGFTAAAAILIATSQLPTLLGLDTARSGNLPDALGALWHALPGIDMATAAIGAIALIALVLIGRYAAPLLWKWGVRPPLRPAIAKALPLAVVVAAAFAASAVGDDIPTVGAISGGLPGFALPSLEPDLWLNLLPSSLAVAIIIFVTATAVAKSLAGTDRSHLDTSREAVALGAGNIAAALTGGYAVGASLSRSALVEDSGAESPLATVFSAGVVILTLLLLSPLLAFLPKTALAALVISAVFGLIKVNEIRGVFRHDRLEGWIILVAFLATLALGVRLGLLAGAVIGLAHYLWFSSLPRITPVGTDDGGKSFRSIERDNVSIESATVLVMRIDRSIYFGNAAYVEDLIFSELARNDKAECLVIDMRAVNAVDASGAAMLLRLQQRLKLSGIGLLFAELHAPVADSLRALERDGCGFHRTVGDAMSACGQDVDFDRTIAPT